MPQVRKFQRERKLAGLKSAAVRPQGIHDAAYSELMLILIFHAHRETQSGLVVGFCVGPARHRAGEYPGAHLAVIDADQSLGARADQAVYGVGPAVWVAKS